MSALGVAHRLFTTADAATDQGTDGPGVYPAQGSKSKASLFIMPGTPAGSLAQTMPVAGRNTTATTRPQPARQVASTVYGVRNSYAAAGPRLPSLPPLATRPVDQLSPRPASQPVGVGLANDTDAARNADAPGPRLSAPFWAETVPVFARSAPPAGRGSVVSVTSAPTATRPNMGATMNAVNPHALSHQPVAPPGRHPTGAGAGVGGAKKSGRAFLRNCHRLENPSDAFNLRGPVQDVDPFETSGGSRKGRGKGRRLKPVLSEEERQAKRGQIVRSFLPETFRARKESRQAEKQARQARRERHEKKKKYVAEKEEKQRRHDLRERIRERRQEDEEEGNVQQQQQQQQQQQSQDSSRSAAAKAGRPPRVTRPITHRKDRPVADEQISAWERTLDTHSLPELEALLLASGGTLSCSSTSSSSSSPLISSRSPSEYSSLSSSTLPPSPSASSTGSDAFLNDNHSDVTEPYEETVDEKRQRFEQEMMIFFDTMHERRMAAACVLQRAYRCHRARTALHQRQQLVYSRIYAHQRAAALCVIGFLQSVLHTRRRQETLARRQERGVVRVAVERAQVAAAAVIGRAVRLWLARRREREKRLTVLGLVWDSRLDDFDRATVLLQRWWRLVRVQKAYWRTRTAEVAEDQRQREAQARLDRAATSLQRVVRGHQARVAHKARVTAMREAAETLRRQQEAAVNILINLFRECELRAHREVRESLAHGARVEAAAGVIQGSWRAALQRRAIETAARQTRALHAAATTVQRAWRRYNAGRELRYLRQLALTAKEDRCREEREAYRATLTLQSFARVVLAKADVRRHKAAAGRSILSAFSALQRMGRGYLARKALGAIAMQRDQARLAAATAAAHYDVWCRSILAAFLAGKRSFALTQRRGRARAAEKRFIRTQVAEEMRRDAAAARIQETFRAHQTAQAEKAAAEELERAKLYVTSCAVRIQQAWRRYRARQRLQTQSHYQARWQQKREQLEEVAWLLWTDQVAAVVQAEHASRTELITEEAEESQCVDWWCRHERRRCRGLISADDEDDEPPPAVMAAVYARAMQAQADARTAQWGALYD